MVRLALVVFEADIRLDAPSPGVFDELVLGAAVVEVPLVLPELRHKNRRRRLDAADLPRVPRLVPHEAPDVCHEVFTGEVRHQAADCFHDSVVLRGSVVPAVRLHGQQVQGGAGHDDGRVVLLLPQKALAVRVDAQDSERGGRDVLGGSSRGPGRFAFQVVREVRAPTAV